VTLGLILRDSLRPMSDIVFSVMLSMFMVMRNLFAMTFY